MREVCFANLASVGFTASPARLPRVLLVSGSDDVAFALSAAIKMLPLHGANQLIPGVGAIR